MASVTWIKICTDIFSDEKILLIRSLPDADALLVIWFQLLTHAGKTNRGGTFVLGNGKAYSTAMFSTIFGRDEETVKRAFDIFEEYGMIEIIDGTVSIINWEKHQNIDGLERIREQNKARQQRSRERARNVTDNADITLHNATDKIREEKKREDEIIDTYISDTDVCMDKNESLLVWNERIANANSDAAAERIANVARAMGFDASQALAERKKNVS